VTIMHTQIKRLILAMNSRLLQAPTGDTRDSSVRRVEAAVVSLRWYDEHPSGFGYRYSSYCCCLDG